MVVTAKFTYLKMSSEVYFYLEGTAGADDSVGGVAFLACMVPIKYKNNYSNHVRFGDFNTSYFDIVSVVIAHFIYVIPLSQKSIFLLKSFLFNFFQITIFSDV